MSSEKNTDIFSATLSGAEKRVNGTSETPKTPQIDAVRAQEQTHHSRTSKEGTLQGAIASPWVECASPRRGWCSPRSTAGWTAGALPPSSARPWLLPPHLTSPPQHGPSPLQSPARHNTPRTESLRVNKETELLPEWPNLSAPRASARAGIAARRWLYAD
jgi:hypothetical protein